MKNMIYQYWQGNLKPGVIYSTELMKKYADKAKEAVLKHSGKILARSANNIALEGREMVRIALAEFPDVETAKKCYDSEEYVEARTYLKDNVISAGSEEPKSKSPN